MQFTQFSTSSCINLFCNEYHGIKFFIFTCVFKTVKTTQVQVLQLLQRIAADEAQDR